MFPLRGVLFFKETGTTNTLTSNYFVRVILGEWKILHSIFWRAWCILVSKEAITCHGKTPFQLLEKSVRLVAVDRGRFLHHPHSQLMQNLFSNWRGAELPHYCRSYLWKIIIIWVVLTLLFKSKLLFEIIGLHWTWTINSFKSNQSQNCFHYLFLRTFSPRCVPLDE